MTLTDDQLRSLRTRAENPTVDPLSMRPAEVLALVEEVERARRHASLRAEPDALAAKAEAGKGLYEALLATAPGRSVNPDWHEKGSGMLRVEFGQLRRNAAALARWEAANAE